MRIDLEEMRLRYAASAPKRRRAAARRFEPAIWEHDYLYIKPLSLSVRDWIGRAAAAGARAVLDVGSGGAPYARAFEQGGLTLTTVDPDPSAGADVVAALPGTGLAPGTFDLVVCTEVVEHCADPFSALAEVASLVRPGGWVIVSAPMTWFYHPSPGDYWRFTHEGLARLCAASGLDVVEIRSNGGSVEAAAQVANFLLYGVLGRWGRPFYLLLNLAALALGAVVKNPLFNLGFSCLARRPGGVPENR